MSFLRKHWPWLLLLLVPLIPLWRAVVLGEAIGPFDQIHQMAPWNGHKTVGPWDVLQADSVLQFYGWRDLVFEAWGKGNLPFWNPYVLAGTPLMANSQSAALYPPHVLLGMLHVPTAVAIALLAWFHLFWAGLGTHRLVKAFGGTDVGGALAGACFALSPFMLSWTALSSVITTVCWIPWILALTVQSYRLSMDTPAGVVARRWVGLALCFAMMVLGGHLQFVAYGFMAFALVAICESIRSTKLYVGSKRPWLSPTITVLVMFGLGVALAAPQLLAVMSYSKFSHRQNVPDEAGYAAYSASAIQPFELVGLAYPKLVGDPSARIQNIESADPVSSYWPQYFKRGANFAEGAIGLGPVVLLLLFAVRRKNLPASMATVGLLGLLLALGTILGKLLYFVVPGWSSTGSPDRAIVVFVLAACVLAGLALKPEEEQETSTPKLFAPVIALGVIGLLSLWYAKVGTAGMPSIYPGIDAEIIGPALADILLPALLTIIAVAVLGFLWRSGKILKPVAWVPIAIAVAAIQTAGLVRTGDASSLKTTPVPPETRVAFVNSPWDIASAAPALMPPNTGTLSRIHEIAGYDSLLHRDTKTLLDKINDQDSAPPANGNMMFIKPSLKPDLLAEAGVTEVWSLKELPQLGAPATQESSYLKYRLPGPGRASIEGRPVTFVSESFTQVKLEAEGPGKLTLRDRNMPGWLPKIDGQHVDLKGETWLEVDVPAGKHQVEFNYVAPGFMTGVYLAFPAFLLLAGLFAISLRKPTVA